MPSFDIVSELDKHQVTNAVDQATRIVTNRFDFKGVDARFERAEKVVTMVAEADIQIQQMLDILRQALIKCGIDIACMEIKDPEQSGKQVKQIVTLREGLDQELAKRIVKLIKDQKMKVQAAIQGEQVRVTGKKRDDLQEAIAMLRQQQETLGMPLQFTNFRD
ncbi:MAG TPA: YajQ family cyclic di-GMP-binding protein [Pseudomonadales bacterium]|nr:YajQ family cyclic di-GMP-binding protein [Pseudomonadales bacterium]